MHLCSLALVYWRHNRHNLSLVLSRTRDLGNDEFETNILKGAPKMVPKGPPQHLNDRLLDSSRVEPSGMDHINGQPH